MASWGGASATGDVAPRDLVIVGRDDISASSRNNHGDLRMRNVLNRFITQHIRTKPSFRDRNCLALGYRIKSNMSNNAGMRNTTDIECEYINTIHSLLYTPGWQKLAYAVGEAIILHLLSRPMFVPGNNGCFLQVAGTLANELVYQQASSQNSSMLERKFYTGRQNLRSAMKIAAEKHLPLPPASDAIPLQVRAKTELPHFNLFYKHSYYKINRVSLSKITTSGSSLMADIFGNVLMECKNGLVRVLEEKSHSSMVLCAGLENMILDVVNEYRRCDVPKALSDHLRIREGGEQNRTTCDSGVVLVPNKKRRTRGCRGGKAEQKKKERKTFLQKKLPTVIASSVAEQLEREIQQRSKSSISSTLLPSSTTEVETVGKHLMHRLHKSISRNIAFQEDGYISQQENIEDESAKEMNTVGTKTLSDSSNKIEHGIDEVEKGRKRRKSSIEDALSSLSTQTTLNSGLLHHLNRNQHTQQSPSVLTSVSTYDADANAFKTVGSKRKHAYEETKYFEMSTPIVHVSEFVKSVSRRTFSIANVWGTRRNMNAFLASVDLYIKLGRYERLTVAQFAANIDLQKLPWLKKASIPSISGSMSTSLFYAFIYWIVSDFINPLIASYFYVTEGEGRGKEVLFYRRSVWNSILERGFQRVEGHFIGIMESETSTIAADCFHRKYASARFMPKKTSLRLICNLRTKRSLALMSLTNTTNFYQDGNYVSNSTLYNCLHVLHHVYTRNPILAGFGSMGVNEIHTKLSNFVKRILLNKEDKEELPKFYVAVLDLEKCYDNVDTVQLYNLVRDLLNNKLLGNNTEVILADIGRDIECVAPRDAEISSPTTIISSNLRSEKDEFGLHKYHVSHRLTSLDRSISKTIRHLTRGDESLTFEEAAEKIANHHKKSIIADGVVVSKLSNEEIMKILHTHLFNHVIRMPVYNTRKDHSLAKHDNFDLFTQVKGIPQGSVLSPLLCNLYYGNAERIVFGSDNEVQRLGLHENTMILRFMDDYVVVSVDQSCVQHFLQRAHQSLKPFGGGVNPLKTRVNFPSIIEVDGKKIELSQIEGKFMPWCGFDLNTLTLEVQPSMTRILSHHLRFSINTECIMPAQAIRRAIKSYVRMKCHPLVLDGIINSFSTVFRNIYEIFLISAMRTHAYLTSMKHVFVLHKNYEYLALCIEEAILFVAHLAETIVMKKNRKRLVLERASTTEGEDDDIRDSTRLNEKIGDTTTIQANEGHCPVKRDQIIWLGFLAFGTAFERRNALYSRVNSILRKKKFIQEARLRKMNLYHDDSILRQYNSHLDNAQWLSKIITWRQNYGNPAV